MKKTARCLKKTRLSYGSAATADMCSAERTLQRSALPANILRPTLRLKEKIIETRVAGIRTRGLKAFDRAPAKT